MRFLRGTNHVSNAWQDLPRLLQEIHALFKARLCLAPKHGVVDETVLQVNGGHDDNAMRQDGVRHREGFLLNHVQEEDDPAGGPVHALKGLLDKVDGYGVPEMPEPH